MQKFSILFVGLDARKNSIDIHGVFAVNAQRFLSLCNSQYARSAIL